eukprot:CAMPEP_0198585002 /NCGR_PEP_ID=MMETSP1462-20131121/128747_1 /TAXON_ID=1333877 /ORGANISM="Brandtodinium nutriculum, Strain RCC3387" /LENGTH=31 /DNA_ID= /DNA_START= /DNA_END= /DNA_ORIENTATION=
MLICHPEEFAPQGGAVSDADASVRARLSIHD